MLPSRCSEAVVRLQPHISFVAYLALLCMLVASVSAISGIEYIGYFLVYATALLITYAMLWFIVRKLNLERAFQFTIVTLNRELTAWIILGLAIIFVGWHFFVLGGIPVLKGALEEQYFSVMLVRQGIFDGAPVLWRYAPNILVKSIFPFLVLFFSKKSFPGFAIALSIGAVYDVSLMNKIFVVLTVLPALTISIIRFDWKRTMVLGAVAVLGLGILVLIQNPQNRPATWISIAKYISGITGYIPVSAEAPRSPFGRTENQMADALRLKNQLALAQQNVTIDRTEPIAIAADTILQRTMLEPGRVITAWFRHIPSDLPYAYGCGYRWLAALMNCELQFFPALINNLENPQLAEVGIHGTMTAATFMEDYANFGVGGLALSGAVLGLVFILLALIYQNDWQVNLALNAVPLVLMLEIQLTTVILTGGWAFTVILYTLLLRNNPGSSEDGKRFVQLTVARQM